MRPVPALVFHQEKSMSSKGLIYTAAVALAVVVAYDKYGKRG